MDPDLCLRKGSQGCAWQEMDETEINKQNCPTSSERVFSSAAHPASLRCILNWATFSVSWALFVFEEALKVITISKLFAPTEMLVHGYWTWELDVLRNWHDSPPPPTHQQVFRDLKFSHQGHPGECVTAVQLCWATSTLPKGNRD